MVSINIIIPQNIYFLSKEKDKKIDILNTKLKELEELKNKPKNLKSDIFSAASSGDLSSIQWFIEQEGINVDKRNSYNWTPLILASLYSDDHPDESLSVVEYLIEKGADVNAKNKYGYTSLHYATTLEVAKTLVEHGSDIESVDNDYGYTPLIWHSYYGRVAIVKYLLSVGANKEAKNKYGETAYDVASSNCKDLLK